MLDRRPDRAGRSGRAFRLSEVWVELIELPHLPVSSPPPIAVPGVPQIEMRDLLEPTCRVEARGQFISQAFVLNEGLIAG